MQCLKGCSPGPAYKHCKEEQNVILVRSKSGAWVRLACVDSLFPCLQEERMRLKQRAEKSRARVRAGRETETQKERDRETVRSRETE